MTTCSTRDMGYRISNGIQAHQHTHTNTYINTHTHTDMLTLLFDDSKDCAGSAVVLCEGVRGAGVTWCGRRRCERARGVRR